MMTLHVVPKELLEQLLKEGVDLSILTKPKQLFTELSVHDMAQIQLATEQFPFQFDAVLGINTAPAPTAPTDVSDETQQNIHYRVGEHVTQLKFKIQSDASVEYTYTLLPIDADQWVAVQQRLHNQAGDPIQSVSSNQSFFEGLIAQALHVLRFETVCKTNLFGYYLKSLTK